MPLGLRLPLLLGRPCGKIILNPALATLLPEHPDICVEIIIDYGLTDTVAERFDAGVRLGESVEKDMTSVRISPDIPMAIVGAPGCFASNLSTGVQI
ncbi:hypothetical protein [Leisingera daeponensis]|uniref:hypothetical protein n=1 Tax=Leisingera daeponensis TaxID=405746 RepID=UPI0009FDF921|nr:hypothetical protein [Leisingera daeponensis]